jgi:hypothetical protein
MEQKSTIFPGAQTANYPIGFLNSENKNKTLRPHNLVQNARGCKSPATKKKE